MFQVFQIQLDEDYTPEQLEAHRDTSVFGSDCDLPKYFKFYKNVCTVLASDCNIAFRVMNAWTEPHKVINEDNERPHSLSVGHILRNCVSGEFYMVERLGFSDVTDQVEYALS
jgi:hypothetical protein